MVPERALRSDEELLAGADPSGAAFAEFYRRHVTAVFRDLARSGIDSATAADVVAETFLAALLQRRRFSPERGSARGWLDGIARNKLRDARRSSFRRRRLQDRLGFELPALDASEQGAYAMLLRDEAQAVAVDLSPLNATQRAAVAARVLAERSYQEIASELGVSEVAARQHVSRGLAVLRKHHGR